jgi:hypothetical protein
LQTSAEPRCGVPTQIARPNLRRQRHSAGGRGCECRRGSEGGAGRRRQRRDRRRRFGASGVGAAPALRARRAVAKQAAIVALLRPAKDGWTAEDWRNFFDERAGIAEFDFGLSRPEVEARAFTCCVAEWLNRNPARSSPGSCLGCGGGEAAHDPLLPFGTGSTGHAWLHARCWQSWHAARKAEAVTMLTAMGIAPSVISAIDFGKNGGA